MIRLSELLAHSFRDFHVKGFDYLCLKRSDAETVKVYFFEGDAAQAPEVVIPHDHRYPFTTDCLAGSVINHEFLELSDFSSRGVLYERFAYRTPLNGGDGFVWEKDAWLMRTSSGVYTQGNSYLMPHDRLHTISVRPDTVLRLTQYADVVPMGHPTRAYRPAGVREPPSLDGLYRAMDADHALMRLRQYFDVLGIEMPKVV